MVTIDKFISNRTTDAVDFDCDNLHSKKDAKIFKLNIHTPKEVLIN